MQKLHSMHLAYCVHEGKKGAVDAPTNPKPKAPQVSNKPSRHLSNRCISMRMNVVQQHHVQAVGKKLRNPQIIARL